jgi:hypothetical protein
MAHHHQQQQHQQQQHLLLDNPLLIGVQIHSRRYPFLQTLLQMLQLMILSDISDILNGVIIIELDLFQKLV